jgi:hypothetical protein
LAELNTLTLRFFSQYVSLLKDSLAAVSLLKASMAADLQKERRGVDLHAAIVVHFFS